MQSVSQKPLSQQVSERMRRAEEQLPLYVIRWGGCTLRLHDGTTRRELVATIRLKQNRKPGTEEPAYFVTACGCNCPDACKARDAGMERPCKHQFMAEMDLAAHTFPDELPEDPAPYQSDDARADEVMEEIAARRAQVRRQMEQDFPAD